MTAPEISLILPVGAEAALLRPTLDSLRRQSMTAQTIAVVTPGQRAKARAAAPEIEIVVDVAEGDWNPGRALNAGCAAATAPLHATVAAGRQLPRSDWLERLIAHHRRGDVVGASGARRDDQQRLLFEPRDVRQSDWRATFCFSTMAGAWRASAWARHQFREDVPAAADRIWAWDVLRDGGVLVVDPFLALEDSPLQPPTAAGIFQRTAREWEGLVAANTPVRAPSFPEALGEWWAEIDATSATPAPLQRLNYYRLARALGRWAGGKLASRRSSRD